MKFQRTEIFDVVSIEPDIYEDERGYFIETFRLDKLEEFLGHEIRFCQDNESKSARGVLRGLHYQMAPAAQTKLVRVIYGSVLDVAVDIRVGSPTFGRHISVLLSGENKRQLLIPRGFAHGFVVLEDETVFSYKVDHPYSPENDRGIYFSDDFLGIDRIFHHSDVKVSRKDKLHPKLTEALDLFDYQIDYYK